VVTLTNTGSLALPITSITRTGTNANQFSQTTTCGASVAVGATCTISVVFKPTTAGVKSATLNVNGGGGSGTNSVTLSGTGIVPTYTLAPTSIAFADQAVSVASAAQVVTLTNTGTLALPITSVTRSGNQFSLTHTCGTSVAVGASCTISVVFKPTTAGAKTSTLTVKTGGGAGNKTVSLSGTGVVPAFATSPLSLAFGNQARNTSSPSQPVTVTNTGSVQLPISSVKLSGMNTSQFSQTNNCAAVLSVGGSCQVSVVFKPTALGAKTATLSVNGGGGSGTASVSLTGTGN